MDNKLIQLEDFRKDQFYRINYLDLEFWEVLQYALSTLFSKPWSSAYGAAPDTWNSILYCAATGIFDPNMMDGGCAKDYNMPPYSPWPEVIGVERTKLYIKQHIKRILDPGFYNDISKPTSLFHNRVLIMKYHLLYTKEEISKNELVINICFMANKGYKRIHIKNYKEARRLLFSKDNKVLKKMYLNIEKLKKIVVDGSSIEIKDESIQFTLDKLAFA